MWDAMKKFISLLVFSLLICNFSVRGQMDAQISQYMFSKETYNPASIGFDQEINLFGNVRQQWVGMPNAPQTTFFAANMPVRLFDQSHGVGIMFYNDKAGIFSTQSVNLQYAHCYDFYDGVLSLGLNVGFLSQTVHGDSVHQITSDYHDITGDLVIPTQSVSAVVPDVGLGALYQYKEYYLGFSIMHLFRPVLNLDDNLQSFVPRNMYLTGGAKYYFSNTRYVLYPSFLFKSDFVSNQYELGANIEKDEKYWIGLNWRYQDAFIFLIGMDFSQGLILGYSFDLATNAMISNTAGSHELFLRYRFNFGKKKTNKYKSVRIL